jgi:hypothetical protein
MLVVAVGLRMAVLVLRVLAARVVVVTEIKTGLELTV